MRLLNGLVDLLEMARRQIGFERSKNQLQEATNNALIEEKNNLQAELERIKTALDNYIRFARQQGELINKLSADKARVYQELHSIKCEREKLIANVTALEEERLLVSQQVKTLVADQAKDVSHIRQLERLRKTLVDEVQTLENQRNGLLEIKETLGDRVQTLESQRSVLVEKLHAHRDARRIIANELNKLGGIDSLCGPLEK